MKKFLVAFLALVLFSPAFALEHEADFSYALRGNLVNIGSYKLIGLFGPANSLELGYSLGPLPTEGYVFSLTMPKLSNAFSSLPGASLLLTGSNLRGKFDPEKVREAEKAVAEMDSSCQGNFSYGVVSFPVVKVQRISVKFIGKSFLEGEQSFLLDWHKWDRYAAGLIEEKWILAGVIVEGSPIFGGAKYQGFFVNGEFALGNLDEIEEFKGKLAFGLKKGKFSGEFGGMAHVFSIKKSLAIGLGMNIRSLDGFLFDAEILGIDFLGLKFQRGNARARAIFGVDLYEMNEDSGTMKVAPHFGINFSLNPDLK